MKVCYNCNENKPLDDYPKDKFQKSNNIHIWTYFNTFISVHRFIQNKDNHETIYQTLSNSLAWLRTCNTFKLRETP